MAAVFRCVGNAMPITIITTLHEELGRLRRLIISISTHDHKTSHNVSASHTCPLPLRAHCVGSSIPLALAISRDNNPLPGTATFFDVQTSRSSMVVVRQQGARWHCSEYQYTAGRMPRTNSLDAASHIRKTRSRHQTSQLWPGLLEMSLLAI